MDQETNKVNSQENGQRRRPPVRYDEKGNPIPPKKRPPVRYDENGNPIPPKKRPPVRYDENGNPIPPKKRPPVRYDENGNPIPPKKRPPVRYDENGNPIPPKKRPPVRYDENGNPIPPRRPNGETGRVNGETGRVNGNTARMSGYDRFKENEEDFIKREEQPKQSEAKEKKGRKIAAGILIGLQALMTVLFVVLVFVLDLLPIKYEIAIAAILLILLAFDLIFQKFKGARVVGMIMAVILSIVMGAGTVYIWKAHNVMDDLTTGQEYTVSDLSVVVLRESTATGLQDLDGKIFGVQANMDKENTEKTLGDLQGQYSQGLTRAEYNGILEQVSALYDGEVDAIILNETFRTLIVETYPSFDSDTRILDGFTYTEKIDNKKEQKKEVDVSEEAFTVFLSGNDEYGEVTLANGRSDVNILATVNPKTRQILLTTTPRDYYIELPFYEGCMDKLTHAGLYGIDCSMETLENLYDIEIDYYVRVNFSGFQDIVDALDGVEVYSDMAFTSKDGYYYDAGYNYVYGEQALSFVRERYAFSAGDVQRGKNQMHMIQAIIDKVTSPAILPNYMDLMDSLSSCFITDMPREKISDLVKMQLDEGGSWQITSNSVNGFGNARSTYSGGAELLSVMDIDETAVEQARKLIKDCEEGKILSNP